MRALYRTYKSARCFPRHTELLLHEGCHELHNPALRISTIIRYHPPIGDFPVLTLRPYQDEALACVTRAYGRGISRPLIALPTGTGKTVVFAHLAKQHPGRCLTR